MHTYSVLQATPNESLASDSLPVSYLGISINDHYHYLSNYVKVYCCNAVLLQEEVVYFIITLSVIFYSSGDLRRPIKSPRTKK